MQQSLEISSSIPLTSAPVAKAGSKADPTDATEGSPHFAELLHQAKQGQQPETQAQDKPLATQAILNSNTKNPLATKPTPDSTTEKPLAKAPEVTHTENPSAPKGEPPTKPPGFLAALANLPTAMGLTSLMTKATVDKPLATQTEALATEPPTPKNSSLDETPQAAGKTTDKTEKNPAQDLLALAMPLPPQPLDLAVLQAGVPLLAQPQIHFNAPQPTEESASPTGAASEASAAIVGGNAIALPQASPQITSQLALMPNLLPLPKPQQNGAAFTLPTGKQETSSPLDTLKDTLNPNPSTSKAQETKVQTSPQALNSPMNNPIPAASAQTDGASLSSANLNIPSLPLSPQPQASSSGTMTTGDLTRQAIGPLEGLTSGLGASNGVGKPNLANSKPNASLPTSVTSATSDNFKKSLSSMQDNLNALHGEIETSPNAAKDLKEALPDKGTAPADSSTLSASDLLTASGLGGSTQTGATSNDNGTNNTAGVPHFASSAQNPTDQIAEGTAYSIKNGHKELIIRLNPDNLGEVRINLTSHGNQELSARLIASTQESHDLLKGQLESLRNTLQSQGVTVERLSVVLAGNTESSNSSHSNSDQPNFQQQQQQASQQGSFQQQFNQQNPSSNGLFNLMNGQQQSGFSQNQTQSQGGQSSDSSEIGLDGLSPSGSVQPTSHDNGRISILA